MKTAVLFAVALAAGPGFVAARPAPASAVPTVAVRYADLNLESVAGARAMLVRIRKAAANVCRNSPGMDGNGADTVLRFEQCYRQSVLRAVVALNAPLVAAAYQPAAGAHQVAQRSCSHRCRPSDAPPPQLQLRLDNVPRVEPCSNRRPWGAALPWT
ncbi:MAG TPA: UrcA family protein [Phenylobacterium sp.]